jgi:hypothetical protein
LALKPSGFCSIGLNLKQRQPSGDSDHYQWFESMHHCSPRFDGGYRLPCQSILDESVILLWLSKMNATTADF